MQLRFWEQKQAIPEPKSVQDAEERLDVPASVPQRRFLKLLAASLGGAGLALAAAPRRALANYTPGSPSDTVDTNLTVQGDLIVNGNSGIGTGSPGGKLDVAGDVCVYGTQAVGSDSVHKKCYYVFATGAWAIANENTWGECSSNNWTWSDLATLQ